MDDAALRAMMPMGFGKSSNKNKNQQQSSKSAAASPPPPAPVEVDEDGLTAEERAQLDQDEKERKERQLAKGKRKAEDADADGDDSDDDESDQDGEVDLGPDPISGSGENGGLPIDESVVLKDHSKSVSALAIDSSGARLATGSYDYDVKLWDFGGMTSSFRPFKSFEPCGSYWIHDLAFSPDSTHLLCISGTAQAKLLDKEGTEVAHYKKGDVYIRDMKNTSGHVSEITKGLWNPIKKNEFATSSTDSTIRLWDSEVTTKQKQVIVVRSKERGTRTKITAANFSADGRTLAAAGFDGTLHLWNTNSNFVRPNSTIENAHAKNTETSSVVFSRDGRTLLSRGGDDSVKIWDVRSFKKPLAEKFDLPNANPETDVIFSLDEQNVLTGTTAVPRKSLMNSNNKTASFGGDDLLDEGLQNDRVGGSVEILSRLDLSPIKTLPISNGHSSIRLTLHPKINQLFVSTSNGSVHVFYSPTSSVRGALLCVDKKSRVKSRNVWDENDDFNSPIITPHAGGDRHGGSAGLSNASKKRKMDKIRNDPKASKMPDRPMNGPGKGGRVGAAATQHVVQNIFNDNSRDQDPREALLKYAQREGDADPRYTGAWSKTQPNPVWSTERGEDEEEENGR